MDDWLFQHGLVHALHPKYPWESPYDDWAKSADFRVGDTYIEYFGMDDPSYDQRAMEKQREASARGLDLIALFPGDLSSLDAKLGRLLPGLAQKGIGLPEDFELAWHQSADQYSQGLRIHADGTVRVNDRVTEVPTGGVAVLWQRLIGQDVFAWTPPPDPLQTDWGWALEPTLIHVHRKSQLWGNGEALDIESSHGAFPQEETFKQLLLDTIGVDLDEEWN